MEAVKVENSEIEYPVIKVENPEYCKLRVHYEADPEIVESKIEEAIGALRNMKIPGFRPGKAPDYAIKSKLKPQLNQYIAREMTTHAIDDIVFDTDIKLMGQPKFENIVVKGKKFSCDIELFSKPEFDLGELKFDIPKPPQQNDEESLAEKSLFNIRQRLGEAELYDEGDVVEMGDQVTLTINGTIDGKPFKDSQVEGDVYQIGSNRWPEFDNYLLGMQAEETREFELTFDDSANGVVPKELQDKTAKFKVTVHMGTKQKPHPLNEEFYQKVGVENIEEMMNKLRSISRESLKRYEVESIRSQIAIKLVEAHDFEVPEFMIDAEVKNVASQFSAGQDTQLPFSDEEKAKFREQAVKNIKLSLILDSIRESEPDSVLNDSEAQQSLAQHLQAQGKDPAEIFNQPNYQPQIAAAIGNIKDEFTLQWVADQANIVE